MVLVIGIRIQYSKDSFSGSSHTKPQWCSNEVNLALHKKIFIHGEAGISEVFSRTNSQGIGSLKDMHEYLLPCQRFSAIENLDITSRTSSLHSIFIDILDISPGLVNGFANV